MLTLVLKSAILDNKNIRKRGKGDIFALAYERRHRNDR